MPKPDMEGRARLKKGQSPFFFKDDTAGTVTAEYRFAGAAGKGFGLFEPQGFCLGFKACTKIMENLENIVSACGDEHGGFNFNAEKQGVLTGLRPFPELSRALTWGGQLGARPRLGQVRHRAARSS